MNPSQNYNSLKTWESKYWLPVFALCVAVPTFALEGGSLHPEAHHEALESREPAPVTNLLGSTFLHAEIKREEDGRALTFLARSAGTEIIYLGSDFKTHRLTLRPSGVAAVATGDYSVVKSDRPFVKSQGGPSALSVSLLLSERQAARCLSNPEFQTFLSQLTLLKSFVSRFEVNAARAQDQACAQKISTLLKDKGFACEVAVGNLKEGGLSIRGLMNEGAVSTGQVESENAEFLSLSTPEGASVTLTPNSQGDFFQSFDSARWGHRKIRAHYSGSKGLADFELDELLMLKLGVAKIDYDGLSQIDVSAGSQDQLNRMVLSADLVQKQLEAMVAQAEQFSGFVLDAVSRGTALSGSGIADNIRNLRPLSLEGRFPLTSKYLLSSRLDLPVSFFPSSHRSMLMSVEVKKLIWGEAFKEGVKPVLKPSRRVSLGVGGFYSLTRVPESPSDASSGLLLSDFLGVHFVLAASARLGARLQLESQISLAPLPPSALGAFSLSNWMNIGIRYFIDPSQGLLLGFEAQKFELKYANGPTLFSKSLSVGMGYFLALD